MGPVSVVVGDVISDEAFELTSVPDDRPVQQLTTKRTGPALSERIRDWGLDRVGARNSVVGL